MPASKATQSALLFGGMLVLCLIFLTIHNLIYDWIFLPRYFENHPKTLLINPDMIQSYWAWPYGKLLIISNIIVLTLPCLILKRAK